MAQKFGSLADLMRWQAFQPPAIPRTSKPQGEAIPSLAQLARLYAANLAPRGSSPAIARYRAPGASPLGALPAIARYDSRASNKSQHDHMVGRLVLAQRAMLMRDIRADIPSCLQPERIFWRSTGEGHRPDVTARYWNGHGVIYEVETAETISIEHTREQCRLFSAFARQHNESFVMVVPRGEEWRARVQLTSWNIVGAVEGI